MSKLEELRARKREAEARVQKLREEQEEEREFRLAEVEAEDAEALAKLLVEHDEKSIRQIKTGAGSIIVKRPTLVQYKRFQDKGSAKSDDLLRLVYKCLLHPSSDRFDEITEEYPATIAAVASATVELAGYREKEIEGK